MTAGHSEQGVNPPAFFSREMLAIGGVLGFSVILFCFFVMRMAEGIVVSIDGYLSFHTTVEILAVMVAGMIFGVGWHASDGRRSVSLILLSTSFLAVGLLDIAHLLSYAGMPDLVTPSGPEKAINFWLAARVTAAGTLLMTVSLPQLNFHRHIRYLALLAALAWTAMVYWIALFHPEWIPATFVPGQGLTPIKIAAEYFIIALLALTAFILVVRSGAQSPYVAPSIFAALGLMILSELSFTLYSQVSDGFNLMGHVYKVMAYAYLYHGVLVGVVRLPYQELAKAERTAKESETRFRLMFDATPDAVFLIDADGSIVLSNVTAETMLGYGQAELIGQKVEILLPESMRAAHVAHRERYSANPVFRPMALGRLVARHKDGRILHVEISLSPILLNTDRRHDIVMVRDVSATWKMENMVRRHSQEFKALVENAQDVIARFDRDMRFTYVNPAVQLVIGRSNAECLGKSWSELGLPQEEAEAWQRGVRSVFDSGESTLLECQINVPPLELRYFHVRMSPEKDEKGSVTSVLVVARDMSERKQYEDQLRYQATHDGLTDLPNRTLMLDRLQQALPRVQRAGRLLAVAYLDIDHFKGINDTLGHATGDELLKQVAERIKGVLRSGDSVGRQSGDEFILLLTDIAQIPDVVIVAEKVLDIFARPFTVSGREVHISGSIGLSVYPQDSEDAETLLRNADVAMYRAKEDGRNGFRFYVAEMDARLRARVDTEQDLRVAIEQKELVLHYQPRVSLKTGQILGFEALVRWNHPREGLVGPDRFIGVAEDTGLIVPLGDWVLGEACRCARAWQDAGLPEMKMAVNLSARQFSEPNLVESVKRALAETRLDPRQLELEITESTVMHDTQTAIATLHTLKRLGITLAVDDFGTGYSSLSYLKLFPIDVLKIDRSFVSDITKDADDAAIVRATVNLAHSLELEVVAEGVENSAQLAFLKYIGCDELQGYYFSRPVPQEDAEHMLRYGRKLEFRELLREQTGQTLLIVDSDPVVRNALARLLQQEDRTIMTAASTSEALTKLGTQGAQVILCEQDSLETKGSEFFVRIKHVFPDTIRILYSKYFGLYSKYFGGIPLAEVGKEGVAHVVLQSPWDERMEDTVNDAFRAYTSGTAVQEGRPLAIEQIHLTCNDMACEKRLIC